MFPVIVSSFTEIDEQDKSLEKDRKKNEVQGHRELQRAHRQCGSDKGKERVALLTEVHEGNLEGRELCPGERDKPWTVLPS